MPPRGSCSPKRPRLPGQQHPGDDQQVQRICDKYEVRKWFDIKPDVGGAMSPLVKALGGLKPTAFILDGEVAVYDHAFISRFEWLHGRPKDALAGTAGGTWTKVQ